jgi:hypothetical protein
LRLSGQSCSNLDGNHILRLQQIASITNPIQPFSLSKSLRHCIFQTSQSEFSMKKAQLSSDGSHVAFWKIFVSFLTSNDETFLSGHLPPTDARVVFMKLTSLQNVLTGRGAAAGNWLSQMRNSVQYRHEQSIWPPSSLRKADRDLLLRLAVQWKTDPMNIELDYPPGGDLGRFVSACSLLVALCRALFERVAKLSSEGRHSFANGALQYA